MYRPPLVSDNPVALVPLRYVTVNPSIITPVIVTIVKRDKLADNLYMLWYPATNTSPFSEIVILKNLSCLVAEKETRVGSKFEYELEYECTSMLFGMLFKPEKELITISTSRKLRCILG